MDCSNAFEVLDADLAKIEEGSLIDTAGILCKDVIVQCSGNIVQSLLQLFEICWDKAGEAVELVVMRRDEGARLSLSVVMAENRTEKLNRWPLPGMCWRKKWRCY